MAGKVAEVDYSHFLSVQIGNWLKETDFELCDALGIADPSNIPPMGLMAVIKGGCVGVLQDDPTIKRDYLFGLFGPRRRRWVGVIWFENAARRAVHDKRWLFEFHGEKARPIAEEIAKGLAAAFKVDIDLEKARDYMSYEYEVLGAHEIPD